MINKLPDGSVVNSNLNLLPGIQAREIYRNQPTLKFGFIEKIHYPNEKSNVSKKTIEYDVTVQEVRPDGSMAALTYHRCQTSNKFASPNNFEKFTLQAATEKENQTLKKGAKVLVLAIDGNAASGGAVIIGGLSYDPASAPTDKDGQFYEWQFNGISIKVDKDGQYSLTFNSFIDQDLKKADEKSAGTKIEIFKDGKMKLSDNEGQSWEIDRAGKKSVWTNGAESITIDKQNKKIDISSSGDISESAGKEKATTTGKDYKVDAGGAINMKSGKDVEIEAGANVQAKSGANWKIESGANVEIKAGANVMIKGGAMAQIKGTLTMLGDGTVPVALVGISQCIGVGNLGFPVSSNIISGSATVFAGA